MTERTRRFRLTNRLVNPVLLLLLHGPAGRVLGRRLAAVRYRGTRTGRPHELVVQYAREGDQVWVMPGHPEDKTWWHNVESPADVEVWLEGRHSPAIALALRGAHDEEEVARGMAVYLEQLPRARKALGLGTAEQVREAVPHTVMVRLDLHRVVPPEA